MADLSKRAQQLSAKKQALLHELLLDKSGRAARLPTLLHRPTGDVGPLSFAQERLWFLDQLAPGSPLYNEPVVMRLFGALDLTLFRRSFDTIMRRHEVLRTSFPTSDGQPVQVVALALQPYLRVADLQALPVDRRATAAEYLAIQEIRQPFELARGPLLRTLLLRLADPQ